MGTAMVPPSWPNAARLLRKFQQHGWEFQYTTVAEYEASSLDTISVGVRFTYTDSGSGASRVGYYDAANNRFTVVTLSERTIVTHFAPSRGEKYVEELPDSTYT
jgi:pyocin large subunit-like protein